MTGTTAHENGERMKRKKRWSQISAAQVSLLEEEHKSTRARSEREKGMYRNGPKRQTAADSTNLDERAYSTTKRREVAPKIPQWFSRPQPAQTILRAHGCASIVETTMLKRSNTIGSQRREQPTVRHSSDVEDHTHDALEAVLEEGIGVPACRAHRTSRGDSSGRISRQYAKAVHNTTSQQPTVSQSSGMDDHTHDALRPYLRKRFQSRAYLTNCGDSGSRIALNATQIGRREPLIDLLECQTAGTLTIFFDQVSWNRGWISASRSSELAW